MVKEGKSNPSGRHLPVAPWIFINDPTENDMYASELASLLPNMEYVQLTRSLKPASAVLTRIGAKEYHDKIVLVTSPSGSSDSSVLLNDARLLRQTAIKRGCNFASIDLLDSVTKRRDRAQIKSWGTNHVAEYVDMAADATTVRAVAEKIYKWLFGVFSVLETLHLIPDEQMKEIEPTSAYKDYEYCPLSQAQTQPKDKRVQFVALIVSKPVVGPNKRLSWRVADKSGTATFYFQYRGDTSQYTWDWVLALKPGDRKCLPRMPAVLIKERAFKTVVKAPFRVAGLAIRGTGTVVAVVGRGLVHVGSKLKLGNRLEWVPELDAGTDATGQRFKKQIDDDDGYVQRETVPSKSEVKVFTAKGEKAWKDDDSLASTTAGSFVDEKTVNLD